MSSGDRVSHGTTTAQVGRPSPVVPIATLKMRAEFQRVRGGGRASLPAFLMEGKLRPSTEPAPAGRTGSSRSQPSGPRFGFTITKKIGNAVARNRIRRRLKAALSELVADHAHDDIDYVVVARSAAFDQDYASLKADLTRALATVAKSTQGRSQSRSQAQSKGQQRPPQRVSTPVRAPGSAKSQTKLGSEDPV